MSNDDNPNTIILGDRETVLEENSPLLAAFQLLPIPAGQCSETVLVAEDEPNVRALICMILKSKGYTVLEANSGTDALRLFEAHEGTIHLLITDVIMPRMSGPELARRISSIRPDTKILYLSGAMDEAKVLHGLDASDGCYLNKPFSMAEMSSAVRATLDRR